MAHSEKKSTMPVIVGVILSILCLSSIGLYFLNQSPETPKKQHFVRQRQLSVPAASLLPDVVDDYLTSDQSSYRPEKLINKPREFNKVINAGVKKEIHSKVFIPSDLPLLIESDASFQQDVLDVSAQLTFLLVGDEYIQLSMSVINDLAQGLRPPLKLLRKFKLIGGFSVEKRLGKFYMSTTSYARYDVLADAINSINIQKSVFLFKKYQPLFDEVFQEYAYPEVYSVLDIIQSALSKVLQAPIIEGEIALIHPTIRYHFSDKKLEGLSALDKQMLRMGPENTRIIQHKLRQLIQAFVTEMDE